ncbi:MAG: hypothetical protein P0S95_06650 [Rhabdochlamydiaceae bacterium]|nr:hypothetical protein [Candidatus Amphrikana amoebophyrae]
MELEQKVIGFEEAVKIFQVEIPKMDLPAEAAAEDKSTLEALTGRFEKACEDRLTLLTLYYNFIDNIDEGLQENGTDPEGVEVICAGKIANSYLKFGGDQNYYCDPSIEVDHELTAEQSQSFPIFLMYLVIGEVGTDEQHEVTILQTIDIEDFQSALFVSTDSDELDDMFCPNEMGTLEEKNKHVIDTLIHLMSFQHEKYEVKIEVIENEE